MTEEPKKKTFECNCGAVLASKQGLARHLNSRKHKILVGEIVIPPKVKTPPKQRGRKPSPDSPENITKILNSLVEDLTENDIKIRREYFRKKTREYRNRKRSV